LLHFHPVKRGVFCWGGMGEGGTPFN